VARRYAGPRVDLPFLEIVLRGSVTFLALLIMMRVVGQREAGGLGITDVLLVVLVAEAAAAGMHGDDTSVTDSLLLVATILFWSVAVDALAYAWPGFGRLIEAQPPPLINDGSIDARVLRREFMTREEVVSQLRLHGIEDPAEVQRAYIEPNGMISVLRHDGGEPDEPLRPEAAL
jgi:uncharacterized membrane protein YcaP (DUF421 family)